MSRESGPVEQREGDSKLPSGDGDVVDSGPRGVRVPQQARSRRTRRRVVEAAMHCFEDLGFDETTTAVIAKRAGIAVGTLYGYFQNKGDILAEVVEQTLGEVTELIVEALEPAANQKRDPREVVRALIDTVFHIQTIRPGTQRVIYERYFKDDVFRAVVEQRQEYTRQALVRFIESIDGSHGLRDVDPETAAWVIFNAVQWNASQAQVTREHDPRAVDAAANAAAEMVVRYLFE